MELSTPFKSLGGKDVLPRTGDGDGGALGPPLVLAGGRLGHRPTHTCLVLVALELEHEVGIARARVPLILLAEQGGVHRRDTQRAHHEHSQCAVLHLEAVLDRLVAARATGTPVRLSPGYQGFATGRAAATARLLSDGLILQPPLLGLVDARLVLAQQQRQQLVAHVVLQSRICHLAQHRLILRNGLREVLITARLRAELEQHVRGRNACLDTLALLEAPLE